MLLLLFFLSKNNNYIPRLTTRNETRCRKVFYSKCRREKFPTKNSTRTRYRQASDTILTSTRQYDENNNKTVLYTFLQNTEIVPLYILSQKTVFAFYIFVSKYINLFFETFAYIHVEKWKDNSCCFCCCCFNLTIPTDLAKFTSIWEDSRSGVGISQRALHQGKMYAWI